MQPFSLYVHIPYCQAKCPYCDFNSYAAHRWPEARYVEALRREMRHYGERTPWAGARVETVFFGGGTPSLFSAESIAALLTEIRSLWTMGPNVETTLEANPGTVSAEKLRSFREAGVNRMSFGVQSFNAGHLLRLGRIHSAAEAESAVRLARAVGFTRVSIDLIFALPEQTLAEWEADLSRACALGPDHVSAYNLTYEKGTPFHRWKSAGQLHSLPEEIEVAMLTMAQERLNLAGYRQYEISNYARLGQVCRHNLTYWRGGAYLGVGAGAHSYAPPCPNLTVGRETEAERAPENASGEAGWGQRWANERQPDRYMTSVQQAGHARGFAETLDERQARGEFVFLGLRCVDGFSGAAFQERFGKTLPAAFPHVADLRDAGFLECAAGTWRLTPRGLLVADSVFSSFV